MAHFCLLLTLLLAAPAAWAGGAMDGLRGGEGDSRKLSVSAPAASGTSPLTLNSAGDLVLPAPRRAVTGLEVLPDETSPELPPAGPEVLPAYYGKAEAGEPRLPEGGVDPGNAVPRDLKEAALAYYKANYATLGNPGYMGIIDFSRHSGQPRFHIVDMRTGAVRSIRVAHGEGSDPDADGYATVFSNRDNSHASSLGFYLTGSVYVGTHGRSLRLHGLSETNSNAYERAVVIHSAAYVQDREVQQGRSWGCPAVSRAQIAGVIAALRGGALVYAGVSGAH